MSERIERVVSTILVLSALTVAGTAVHREFASPAAGASVTRGAAPSFDSTWNDALAVGNVIGNANARTKLVVLSDLECPFCSKFHAVAKDLVAKRGGDVQVVFVHFPLTMHRFAMPAARAAECARTIGKFEPFIDQVYRKQDSLGIKSWGSYAMSAGIADTTRIASCAQSPERVARIEAGLAYGKKIGVYATPTVILDGWRFSNPPSEQDLNDALDSLKKGVEPFARRVGR